MAGRLRCLTPPLLLILLAVTAAPTTRRQGDEDQRQLPVVTVDGHEQRVWVATVDGGPQARLSVESPCRPPTNGSFVFVRLGPGPPPSAGAAPRLRASGGGTVPPRRVVVTIPRQAVDLPKRLGGALGHAALLPRPVNGAPPPAVTPVEPGQWAFTVSTPGRWVLELTDDRGSGPYQQQRFSSGLMVFAEFDDPSPPRHDDPSVTYFSAGVHRLPLQPSWHLAGEGRGMSLRNDSTVYLAPGAVVLGTIRGINVRNVSIRGGGILAAAFLPGESPPCAPATPPSCMPTCPTSHAISITGGSSVHLEGITIMHTTSWNVNIQAVKGVFIDRLKILGWKVWGDGVDLVSVQDAVVQDCFVRSDDDAIAIKGIERDIDSRNITVQDSVLFNQQHGNCMEIGVELNNRHISDVTFARIVCIHEKGAVMGIHNGGRAIVSNILWTDIVAQTLSWPEYDGTAVQHSPTYGLKLLEARIYPTKYCRRDNGCFDPSLRGSIAGVHYRRVQHHTNGVAWLYSRLLGNSSAHNVTGVVLEDVTVDGKRALSLHDINATANAYVHNISFVQ